MKTRNLSRTFDPIDDLGYNNLYVSGCSFTYNNSDEHLCTWPYYLRDKGNFKNVVDSSLPGAGNYHISQSLIWTIENNNPAPDDTLIIVMWSGNNRDDKIIDINHSTDYPMEFKYSDNVISGISGGSSRNSNGNHNCNCDRNVKSPESRAIENFLYIVLTYHYLTSKGYRFLFLDYLDRTIPNRGDDIEIRDFLNNNQISTLNSIINSEVENIYKWSVKNDLLDNDDWHPNPFAHLRWTSEILLPYLVDNFSNL